VAERRDDTLGIEGFEVPVRSVDVLVVGAGAAGLNACLHLDSLGIKDVLLVCESLNLSTSRNAGSDKQTYYKLSFAGEEDSVRQMAEDLFEGGCVHGDIALVEAASSPREFFHLVNLGVPFPHDEYGRFGGYRTDNDPRQRASSTGPWTSRSMVECLLAAVRDGGIAVEEGKMAARLVCTTLQEPASCLGAILLNLDREGSPEAVEVVLAKDVVWAGGGPGDLFPHSVYPEGLWCSVGIPILAGAVAQNMTEMQFGIASLRPRWNLSGSYQQVVPSYVSTDVERGEELDFLDAAFRAPREKARAVFRKGYEWPLDARKLLSQGSSRVDLLVLEETLKGRRVWMDYTKDPLGKGDLLDPGLLPEEARSYLEASNCLVPGPANRLERMNSPAVERYLESGVDLRKEPIEVGVCSQHLNGGIRGSLWWESSIEHLYVVGEANGSHGISRPGGAALNAGQVGGLRAAQRIASRKETAIRDKERQVLAEQLRRFLVDVGKTLRPQGTLSSEEVTAHTRLLALKAAGPIRDGETARSGQNLTRLRWEQIQRGEVTYGDRPLAERLRLEGLVLTCWTVLASVAEYASQGGGSRGGFVVQADSHAADRWLPENESLRNKILELRFHGDGFKAVWQPVRPLPSEEPWFETMWRRFREGDLFEE